MDRRVLLLLLPSACSLIQELPPFVPAAETQTLVLVVLSDPTPKAWVIDRRIGAELPAFHADTSAPVVIAELAQSIEVLRLHVGSVEARYGESGELLREPIALSQLGSGTWDPIDDPARAKLAQLRFVIGPGNCTCLRILPDGPKCDDACVRPTAPMAPQMPAPPEAPRLGPCPLGWLPQRLGDSEEVCDPPAPVECGPGTVQFLGDAGCLPHGQPCGGEFSAAPLPSLYAKVGAPAGGDGSLGAPFSSLSEAIAAVSLPGTTILLGRGTYDEAPLLDRSVRIQGSCVEGTILTPRTTLRVTASSVALDRLTIRGREGLLVEEGARVEASTLLLTSTTTTALGVRGTFIGSEIWVPDARDQAIRVHPGGALHLSHARIEQSRRRGLDAYNAELELFDVWFLGTGASALSARSSTLVGQRLVVEVAGACGIYLYGSSTATVSDYVANGTIEEAICLEPGELTLDRAWLTSNRDGQIVLRGPSRATVRDLIATESQHDAINCEGAKSLRLERTFVARNTRYNLNLRGECGPIEIEDLISRSPRLGDPPNEDTAEGLVYIGDHGLSLQRALVEDTVRFGVVIDGPAELSDLTIHRVGRREANDDGSAHGLELRTSDDLPMDVTLDRVVVRDAFYVGVKIGDPVAGVGCTGSVRLRDIAITDTADGLEIRCPVADVERVSITGSKFDGLDLTLRDTSLDNIAPIRDLVVIGSGLQSNNGGVAARVGGLELERAQVANGGLGIWEGPAGRVVAHDTVVEGNVTGLAIFPENDVMGLEEILFLGNMALTFPIRLD